MAIDASIYNNVSTPDILGGVQRGLQMSDMIRTRQKSIQEEEKQNTIKQLTLKNLVDGPDGSKSLNQKGLQADLYKIGAVAEAQGIDEQMQKQQMSQLQLGEAQYKKALSDIDLHTRLLSSVVDQPSLDAAHREAQKAGYDTSKDPQVFDQNFLKYKDQEMKKALSYKDQIENQYKEKNYNLERQKVGIMAEEKQRVKTEKKMTAMNEIEDRRVNIKQNLDLLKKQITKYGTFEVVGSENQDMERRLDQVATDMAKLMDPTSVARPSEVEQVKDGLIRSGFKNSNATALKILNNFEAEVDKRADSAYKIRGLEQPKAETPKTPLHPVDNMTDEEVMAAYNAKFGKKN